MRCAWFLTLVLVLAACGDDVPQPPPAAGVPSTPEAALTWVREAADDEPTLRERLAAWPLDADGFDGAEESRVVLTWRLRLALQDGDVETALRRLHMLEDLFDGEGRSPEGRTLAADVVRGALFDEALYQARVRIEGAKPDRKGAESALAIAGEMSDGEQASAARVRETETWIGLDRLDDLDSAVKPAPRRGAARPTPCVLVVADDFALGESVFIGVLERWQRDGKPAGLEVRVLPVFNGQVRMGIRRVPAEEDEARASIEERVARAGLVNDGAVVRGEALQAVGLGPQEAVVLVANADGRIIARQSGRSPDPRELDVVVEKLISR